MSSLMKLGEMAAQQVGQMLTQSVVKNPQAAIATGVTVAKTVGTAVVVAAPYVAIAAGGAAVGYGAYKLVEKLFDL